MKIDNIEVSNFKCFKHIKLNLNEFNVIIGKNASGKSNIINIIKFIKDMLINGIDQAIDLQGGINYLYNTTIKTDAPIKVAFTINTFDEDIFRRMKLLLSNENIMLEKYKVSLIIQPNKKGSGYKIIENKLEIFYLRLEQKIHKKIESDKWEYRLDKYKIIDKFKQTCYEKNGKMKEIFSKNVGESLTKKLRIHGEIFLSKSINGADEKFLLANYVPVLFLFSSTGADNIKIYDFNPKNLKSASIINRQKILEEDGSNIANVLQRILKNSEEKKKLLLILKKLMPFIEDISTEKSFNKSMYFKVEENNKNNLPSALLSDGTVNIIAIIVALYFEKNNDVVVIEEPEKNIHPRLANQLVSLMKDVGDKKQVIITTHNTQILSSVELKDIIYVYRNEDMYSYVETPKNNKKVKEFIKNELDIGDLFYDGLFVEGEV